MTYFFAWLLMCLAMMVGYFMGHSFGYNKGYDSGYELRLTEERESKHGNHS